MKLTTVISGGQTGADQAGLHAALYRGLATGGTAPKGFRTERGPEPDLGATFGLVEHWSAEYRPRTEQNIKDADGTVIFGVLTSNGSRLTWQLCAKHNKPCVTNPNPEFLREWLTIHEIRTLNVAGNRASVNPGIFAHVTAVLLEAFL